MKYKSWVSILPLRTALIIPLFCGVPQAWAQQKVAPNIALENPELYYAFFRAHTQTNLMIQSSSIAAASQLSSSTAAVYNVTASDLPKITAEVNKFNSNLFAWQKQLQNYVAQQRIVKKEPDLKTLAKYQRQRQRLVMNAHAGLHRALSKASWTGLYGYINGAFAATIHQTAVNTGVAK